MSRTSKLTARQWLSVEQRLNEGAASVRSIAKEHGISEAAVRAHMKGRQSAQPAAPAKPAPRIKAERAILNAAKPPPVLPKGGFRLASATVTLSATAEQPSGAASTAPAPPALTEAERSFCFHYVRTGNATRSYMEARGTTHVGTAATEGSRLLRLPQIQGQIELERAAMQARVGFDNEQLMKRLVSMATADPRELVEHITEACRYCHGLEHEYQRTQVEYDRDLREFETHGRQRIGGVYVNPRSKAGRERKNRLVQGGEDGEVFEVQGGVGFDPANAPHPHCPQCHGHGHGRTLVKDTRLLSEGAALLYAGTEETKDGLRIKMHDQVKVLDMLARMFGAYDADNRQRKPEDALTALLSAVSGQGAALPITRNPAA